MLNSFMSSLKCGACIVALASIAADFACKSQPISMP